MKTTAIAAFTLVALASALAPGRAQAQVEPFHVSGRGIVDFVSSLTDAQAVAFAARLNGGSGLLWTSNGL